MITIIKYNVFTFDRQVNHLGEKDDEKGLYSFTNLKFHSLILDIDSNFFSNSSSNS